MISTGRQASCIVYGAQIKMLCDLQRNNVKCIPKSTGMPQRRGGIGSISFKYCERRKIWFKSITKLNLGLESLGRQSFQPSDRNIRFLIKTKTSIQLWVCQWYWTLYTRPPLKAQGFLVSSKNCVKNDYDTCWIKDQRRHALERGFPGVSDVQQTNKHCGNISNNNNQGFRLAVIIIFFLTCNGILILTFLPLVNRPSTVLGRVLPFIKLLEGKCQVCLSHIP